jgi:hypothetical protein
MLRSTPQRNNHRPAGREPTICGDVLSCARAESGDDYPVSPYAAVPSGPHAGGLVVKPDGTSTNRTAAAASVAWDRTTRSSPAGNKRLFAKYHLGAHPRAPPRRRPPWPLVPPPAAGESAADIDNSVDGDIHARPRSFARSGWHAIVASGLLPPDTPHRNTALGRIRA